MINNDKRGEDIYLPLDGWLFWFDIDDRLWKCTTHEDYVKSLKNPFEKSNVISATSIAEIIRFLCTDLDNVN
jgi:hypothetical protein